jgi:hypothetical protein
LRVNVSTAWAPGSSGSPVFDRAGNVIGHVSQIATLGGGPSAASPTADGDKKKSETKVKPSLITLHEAIPARPMQRLAEVCKASPVAKEEAVGEEPTGEGAAEGKPSEPSEEEQPAASKPVEEAPAEDESPAKEAEPEAVAEDADEEATDPGEAP